MPEVTKEQAGAYRQIGERLRISRAPGKGETLSERQRARGGRYLDEDEPTMITLEEGDQVDVDFLIKVGAIEPKAEPARAQPKGRAKRVRKSRAKPAQVEEPSLPDNVGEPSEQETEEVGSG
jgi:hypothetical protein